MTNLKLILYGIGRGLDLVEKRIKKEHEVVGYMDSDSRISIFRGKPFYRVVDLPTLCFDYIVITVQGRKTALEIYHMIIAKYGIPEECIIPFYVYANCERYRVKLKACKPEKIQGLIFGNSHAECGYLEEDLCVPFLNMAVSSQDIYFNYKTFQNCIFQYGKRWESLSYIIIDMYDYYYLNCDTSMTGYMINYILWGGYLDEHNFKYNHNYTKTFGEELSDMAYMPQRASRIRLLFDDDGIRSGIRADDRWKHIKQHDFMELESIIKEAVINRYENTIKENKKLLRMFLDEIKSFHSDIKIIFTLIPRYIEMERATKLFMKPWEEEFHDIMNRICEKYDALFWNYKNREDISENHAFYYDIGHLNTTGARALTSLLNEDLKKWEKK